MSDEELIARLRERAVQERIIQKNNEAVAAALMGQRLLFDQGIHSASNSFAVRLGLEHENCAKNDAKLANDWDTAADRIEALTKERDQWISHAKNAIWADTEELKEAEAYAEELEKELNTCRMAQAVMDNTVADLEGKLAKAAAFLEEIAITGDWFVSDMNDLIKELKGESQDGMV